MARNVGRSKAAQDELIEVDGSGAGCLLVTTDCLRNVGQPAFKFNWRIGGSFGDMEGEDGHFFRFVKKTGEKVWLSR